MGSVVASLEACFGGIRDNLSQYCKYLWLCVGNNITIASSRTYVLHPGVQPMLSNMSDIKDVVVET